MNISESVRIAQAALDVAEREINKSQAAHSPSLDLTGGYSRNYASGHISSPADIVTRHRSGQYRLGLNVSLFGGGVQARVREAISFTPFGGAQDVLKDLREKVFAG
ncbi:MAG: TolC family protein [Pseudomonadota bacterium]